jgi:uncharacterized repeat protein (TIGR03837 family)
MIRVRQWDIFCKVIDNFGDIGVCWRLAAELARRGAWVRLWADDASALRFMAPGGCPNVQVLRWDAAIDLSQADLEREPPQVLIEGFGCEIAPDFIAACARIHWANGSKPVWINLEYLSAEPYVGRSHGLPSPVQHGAGAGWTKWFFYPGFERGTGGLLREPDLAGRQRRFDRDAWLARLGIAPQGEKIITLFCYEPAALPALIHQLSAHGIGGASVHLLVAAGRAKNAVKAVFEGKNGLSPNESGRGLLSISYLPLLSQTDFDHLLWAGDLNFVRGEDSLVRAIWAGKPFVWQAYPQSAAAHFDKLGAFLDMLQAPPSLREFHACWNAASGARLPPVQVDAWSACAAELKSWLQAQDDLCTRLLAFVDARQEVTS